MLLFRSHDLNINSELIDTNNKFVIETRLAERKIKIPRNYNNSMI